MGVIEGRKKDTKNTFILSIIKREQNYILTSLIKWSNKENKKGIRKKQGNIAGIIEIKKLNPIKKIENN